MTDWRNAPGIIDPPVIFFVNQKGKIIIAPHVDHRTPEGYVRKECKYLHEVDKLTKEMNKQDFNEFRDLMEKDREIMRQRRDKTRRTLRQRMLAVDCTAFEIAFIKGALAHMDVREKEMTEFSIRGYFHAREFDSASTDPIDKHGEQVKVPKMSDRLASLLTK